MELGEVLAEQLPFWINVYGKQWKNYSREQQAQLAALIIDICLNEEQTITMLRPNAEDVHNPVVASGPNDPCPCGSGKPLSKCCGKGKAGFVGRK